MTRRNPAAYTLIESAVAVGIFVLLVAVSIPAFLGYQKSSKLKNEARLMATNIRLAQQYAITEQKIYYFKIFPAADDNYYQIINSDTGSVIRSVDLNAEIRVSQITGLSDNAIRFTATGGVIETGNIYLANDQPATSSLQIKPSGYVEINE